MWAVGMMGSGEVGLKVVGEFGCVVSRNAYGVSPEVIAASAVALAILAAPVLVLPELLL